VIADAMLIAAWFAAATGSVPPSAAAIASLPPAQTV